VNASGLLTRHTVIADPPLAKFLFSDTRMAIVWLVLRVYVGYSWVDAGWHKILDTGAKTNYIIDDSGLLAFWNRIAAVPAAPAKPVILGTPWKAPKPPIAPVTRVPLPQSV
jgi:hypothetical protein